MSIETLKAELHTSMETPDFDQLMLMREAAVEKEDLPDINAGNYWQQLPMQVRARIERGLTQSRTGMGIPHEEATKMHPDWLRK